MTIIANKQELVEKLVDIGCAMFDEQLPLISIAHYIAACKVTFPELTDDDIKTMTYRIHRMK